MKGGGWCGFGTNKKNQRGGYAGKRLEKGIPR